MFSDYMQIATTQHVIREYDHNGESVSETYHWRLSQKRCNGYPVFRYPR